MLSATTAGSLYSFEVFEHAKGGFGIKVDGKEMLLPQDQNHRMKLLRSQTVEGYAVRHSNFTKLNHQRLKNNHRIAQTMPSPPPLPFYQQQPLDAAVTDSAVRPPTPLPTDRDLPGFKSIGTEQKQLSFFKASGHDGVKEECVAELLTAIKTVLQERLVKIFSFPFFRSDISRFLSFSHKIVIFIGLFN
jgi:hypothetical protein